MILAVGENSMNKVNEIQNDKITTNFTLSII